MVVIAEETVGNDIRLFIPFSIFLFDCKDLSPMNKSLELSNEEASFCTGPIDALTSYILVAYLLKRKATIRNNRIQAI